MYIERGNWGLELIEQWSQFFRKDNWYTFNPCVIELENDVCMGGAEFTLIFCGLGIRVRYNYADTEQRQRIRQMVEELFDEGEVVPEGTEQK